MKEKSWWSNNSLPVTVAIFVFLAVTVGGIYGLKAVVGTITEEIKKHPETKQTEDGKFYEKGSRTTAPAKAPNTSSDSTYGPYMQSLQSRIKRNWYPPKGNETKRVTVFFKVDREGKLHNLKVTPSGYPDADAAARKAVESSAPYNHLPSGTTEKIVDIQFTFDYNVFDKSGHRTRPMR